MEIGHVEIGRLGWRPVRGLVSLPVACVSGKRMVCSLVLRHMVLMAGARIMEIRVLSTYVSWSAALEMSTNSTGYLAG